MDNAMRKLQVWNQLLVICLNTPPRPTWGHAMHFCDKACRPPPFIKSPNKGANRSGLSWGVQTYINILWKWPSKILEHHRKIPRSSLDPPLFDPLRIDPFIYQSISLDVRIPNYIYILIDTWHQKVMILEASCSVYIKTTFCRVHIAGTYVWIWPIVWYCTLQPTRLAVFPLPPRWTSQTKSCTQSAEREGGEQRHLVMSSIAADSTCSSRGICRGSLPSGHRSSIM